MKKFVAAVVTCTLMLALAVPAQAQATAKKKEKGDAQPQAISQLNKSLEKVELTAEQKASLKEIQAKHKGPLAELQKSRETLLGADVIKKMSEARKAATAEGKKGKDLQAAVNEAAGLTAEQTAKLDELQKKITAATTALKKDVLAILTAEQKEASGITVAKGGKGKKKNSTN